MNFFIVAIKVQKTSVYTNGGEEQMSIAPGPESRKQFGDLIEKYERGVLHLCCIYLRDMHMAEDAVQETFLKAYKSLNAFRGESSEKTWLYRIPINVCIDMRPAAGIALSTSAWIWISCPFLQTAYRSSA